MEKLGLSAVARAEKKKKNMMKKLAVNGIIINDVLVEFWRAVAMSIGWIISVVRAYIKG